jgi:hypothetical protein
MSKYTFIADAGHGWISVPLEDIERLGLTDKITPYSYMTDKRAYLEEDCDAGVFLEAAGIDIDSLPYSDSDKCRSHASYNPKWIHEPFGIGREAWIHDNGNNSKGVVTKLCKGHYIVEVEQWVAKLGETLTFEYGIPASNPLKYCTPA